MAGSARAFMDFLREHRSGRTHDEITDQFQELVAAVVAEEKAGSITITFKIDHISDGVEVHSTIAVKPPKKDPGTSIFFVTPDNNLVRNDPRQEEIKLRELSPSTPAKALA